MLPCLTDQNQVLILWPGSGSIGRAIAPPSGMLTRPEVDEAKAEAKSMRSRPTPKIALFFQPNFTF